MPWIGFAWLVSNLNRRLNEQAMATEIADTMPGSSSGKDGNNSMVFSEY